MAETTENLIRFGWLSESQMLAAIQSGDLKQYNVCFTSDTYQTYLIDKNLSPIALKSRVSIYSTVAEAKEQINIGKSHYAGEIISIRNNEYFSAYVVYQNGQVLDVKPVYEESDLDYNNLSNVPIKNVSSSSVNRVELATLDDGVYKVNFFVTPDNINVNSIVGNIVIVETTNDKKVITRISSDSIYKYTIEDEEIKTDFYCTSDYLESKGYATTESVTTQMAALKTTLEAYIRNYVENTVTLLVKYLINEELDSRYATDSEIQELFNNQEATE